MANTVTKTTLLDGPRNLVVMVNILGDGSGEETNTNIVTRASFSPAGTETLVQHVFGNINGFTASLSFDATTDLPFAQIPATWFDFEYDEFGGISSNKAGAGSAGDILITTTGLGTGSGKRATFYLVMKKN